MNKQPLREKKKKKIQSLAPLGHCSNRLDHRVSSLAPPPARCSSADTQVPLNKMLQWIGEESPSLEDAAAPGAPRPPFFLSLEVPKAVVCNTKKKEEIFKTLFNTPAYSTPFNVSAYQLLRSANEAPPHPAPRVTSLYAIRSQCVVDATQNPASLLLPQCVGVVSTPVLSTFVQLL